MEPQASWDYIYAIDREKPFQTASRKRSSCIGHVLVQFAHGSSWNGLRPKEETHQFQPLPVSRHGGTASGLRAYNCVPNYCLCKSANLYYPNNNANKVGVVVTSSLVPAGIQGKPHHREQQSEQCDCGCGPTGGNDGQTSRPRISQSHQAAYN